MAGEWLAAGPCMMTINGCGFSKEHVELAAGGVKFKVAAVSLQWDAIVGK